jgi:hypothetical protein
MWLSVLKKVVFAGHRVAVLGNLGEDRFDLSRFASSVEGTVVDSEFGAELAPHPSRKVETAISRTCSPCLLMV